MCARSRHLILLVVLVLATSAALGAARAEALSYSAHVDYAVGNYPYSVAVGDFNGDGKQDLVSTSNDNSTTGVLLGKGDGTFATKVDYATGTGPRSVAVGDFDGDGKQDLVTANGADTVSVLLGNGDGAFATNVDYATGSTPHSVVVGDFNGDDKQDLVTANYGASTVSVLLGNGDGTFRAKVDYSAGDYPTSVTVADFNGDDKQDLACASFYGTGISVLLGHGDGTFTAKVGYGTSTHPYSVAVGDFNGDGNQDLVTANNGGNSVSVLLGNGDGTFAVKVDYGTGTHPYSVAVGDFNGDGNQDLVSASDGGNSVSVLLGNGDGTFATKVDYGTGTSPRSVAVGDFDGDGVPDLVTANAGLTNSNVSVLLGEWSAPSGSVILGAGASATANRFVSVDSLVAEATQMRLRDADGGWRAWRCFAHTTCWTLPSGDGSKTVQVQYRNSVADVTLSAAILLDTAAPTTTDDAPSGWQAASSATVTLSASDATSGVAATQYKLDDATGWSSGTSVAVSGEGAHTIKYRSVDAAGNTEETESCTVKLDTVAPTTGDDAPSGWQKSSSATVHLTAGDATSGVATTDYSTDGGATWTMGSSLTVSTEGETTVRYRSTDEAGNVETARSCTVKLDTVAPTTGDDAPSGWQKSSSATVHLTASDATSGVAETQYKVDDATGWSTGTSVAISGEGVHAIRCRSIDEAGNVEETESCTVKLDAATPVTTQSGADSAWHRYPATVVFSASDAVSGVARTEYSTDGGATWTTGSSLTASAEGETAVSYRSTDAAGNVEATKSCSVKVDTQAPSTSGAKVSVRRGKAATFRVKVADPTPCSAGGAAVTIKITNKRGKLVKTLPAFANVATNTRVSLTWAKCTLAKGTYTYAVFATDAAGNEQKTAGGNKLVVK
jgi:hypothetical protein